MVIGAKWQMGEPPGAAGTNAAGGVVGVGGVGGSSGSSGSGGTELSGEGGTSEPPLGGAAGEGQAGETGEILFAADHEDGSLAVWDDGPDADAGGYYADAGPPRYSEAHAHSGSGAAEVTIDTSTNTAGTIARLYRRVERNSAYYSAWFYLLEDHTPSQWWSIFLFRAVKDRSQSIDLWDVDLIREDDRLTLSIYDHRRSDVIDVPSKPTIPIAEWFQLEAYLEFGPGRPSRIDYWLDGQPILSLPDLSEVPVGEPVYWVIGNGGSLLSPPVSTVYVDDALVSATRVGAE